MGQLHNVDVLQAKLNLSALSTDDRVALSSLIAQMAPKSTAYASNPVVKDAADNVIKSGGELELAVMDMRNAEMKLAAARAAVGIAEGQLVKKMMCLKSVAETNCASEAELNDLGFNRRAPKAAPAALTAPETITAKAGNDRGSMIVHVRRVARIANYAAEISPDAGGPGVWQSLPGLGARRTLTGYVSGERYWVRFRAVRANEAGPWSEPVSVVAR